MIKVSVIVPVYNGEKHLRECLESICGQTLEEIEILCVDDGSTDSSWEILEEYRQRDERVKLYHQENQYAGVARNLGKSHAVGEYLAFWDCDDFFDLQALEKLYGCAKEWEADVCVCGGSQYLESKQASYPCPPYLAVSRVPAEGTFNRFTNPSFYLSFTNAVPWNKLFRRAYIEKLHLDFQPIRNGNDVYFTTVALGLADRIATVNERLVTYRVEEESGLVHSLCRAPLAPIQAWTDTAKRLESAEGFGEQSFANRALGAMLYLLQNLTEWEAFCTAVEALQAGGLTRLHLVKREPGYYTSDFRDRAVRKLWDGTPGEIALFLMSAMYTQREEARAERRGLRQEIAERKKAEREACREWKSSLRETRETLADTRTRLKETRETLADTRTRFKETRETLADTRTRFKETRETLADTRTRFRETRETLAETEEQLRETEEKRRREEERAQRLQRENGKLTASLEAANRENARIRASWSYRIGRAIVWLPGKIRRLFRRS